jgi:hypothetical protein
MKDELIKPLLEDYLLKEKKFEILDCLNEEFDHSLQ